MLKNIFDLLGRLKEMGLDADMIAAVIDDIKNIAMASTLMGRIRAVISLAQRMKGFIPGEFDDKVIDFLASLVEEVDQERLADAIRQRLSVFSGEDDGTPEGELAACFRLGMLTDAA